MNGKDDGHDDDDVIILMTIMMIVIIFWFIRCECWQVNDSVMFTVLNQTYLVYI